MDLMRSIHDLENFCRIMKNSLKKDLRKETDLLDFEMRLILFTVKNMILIVTIPAVQE